MNGNKPKKGKILEKKLYFVYHFLVTKSVVCNKILFKEKIQQTKIAVTKI